MTDTSQLSWRTISRPGDDLAAAQVLLAQLTLTGVHLRTIGGTVFLSGRSLTDSEEITWYRLTQVIPSALPWPGVERGIG